MKLIMERFNKFLVEGQDVKRVAKIVLIDEDDKVLILKRAKKLITEKSPWEWDLPGGHAETEERLEDTIVREVWEETGLSLWEATDIYADEETTFFVSYDWDGEVLLSNEHEDYIWISPEDMDNYDIGDKYSLAIGRITTK
jgi:8-oxo-dGTP pyrophosphatase MutT (NUDIX family)